MMSDWGYSLPEEPVAAAAPAVQQVAAVEAQPSTLTPDELDAVRNAPPEIQGQIAELLNAGLSAEELAERVRATINQASTNAEASMLQGGYDIGVATAVSGSVGVGTDQATVEQAAADFARDAARAVSNGQTLDEVRTADPNLSLQAQQAIYEQVAQQQGTSSAEIEQRAEEQRAADMQAIQGAVFGLAGGAALLAGAGQAFSEPPSLAPFAAADTAPVERPYGITTDPLPVVDMGSTTAALAAIGSFVPQPDLPNLVAGRGQGQGLA